MEVKKRQLILVHVLSGGYRSDYQIFDLEAEKVLKTRIQSSLHPDGDGDVVVSGTSIYNIGGLRHSIDEDFPCLDNLEKEGDEHIHLGASCLELNIDDEDAANNRWKAIPPMKDFRVYPSCASLGGKVYALGSLSLEDDVSIGEVFQHGTSWKRLLPPIENMVMSVSPHVISDEKNARLLVHICNISCLYAYYPDMATWECLMLDFTAWHPSTKALFDDHVLFYHLPESSNCFVAFDLSTKIWFKVKYSSNFPRQAISFCEWEGLLHLGNDIMCLASYCPFGDPVHTNICFLKFRVERISSHDLLLTFVSSHSFPFEGRLTAYRFLLLP